MKVTILHYTCSFEELGSEGIAGAPEFKPTGRSGKEFDRALGNEPSEDDRTEIYKCETCKMTVGVEQVDDTIAIYI